MTLKLASKYSLFAELLDRIQRSVRLLDGLVESRIHFSNWRWDSFQSLKFCEFFFQILLTVLAAKFDSRSVQTGDWCMGNLRDFRVRNRRVFCAHLTVPLNEASEELMLF